MLHQRPPIGDQHSWSETYRRLTWLIRDPSETDMCSCRPAGPSETDMPHRILTCSIRDRHAPSETDMPVESHRRSLWIVDHACQSAMEHVTFRWVMLSSPMGLRSGMSVSRWSPIGLRSGIMVSNGSPIRHVGLWRVSDWACWSPIGLWWVSDKSLILIIFSRTLKLWKFCRFSQYY